MQNHEFTWKLFPLCLPALPCESREVAQIYLQPTYNYETKVFICRRTKVEILHFQVKSTVLGMETLLKTTISRYRKTQA
jgi:hypothetical protein